VVDVVVELEGLLRHPPGGQRVVGIGKVGKFKSHDILALLGCGRRTVARAPAIHGLTNAREALGF
jgi:hypothetical protein